MILECTRRKTAAGNPLYEIRVGVSRVVDRPLCERTDDSL